jgi:hypothetical protein
VSPPIVKLDLSYDLTEIQAVLKCSRHLWNKYDFRTKSKLSPHREASDIWLRYYDPSLPSLQRVQSVQEAAQVHPCIWYPSVLQRAVAALTEQLSLRVTTSKQSDVEIGQVLITKVPPHSTVYPHKDGGYQNEAFTQYGILLKANPNQSFCFGHLNQNYTGDRHPLNLLRPENFTATTVINSQTGDVIRFKNTEVHWVTNPTDEERITLIIYIRSHHEETNILRNTKGQGTESPQARQGGGHQVTPNGQ